MYSFYVFHAWISHIKSVNRQHMTMFRIIVLLIDFKPYHVTVNILCTTKSSLTSLTSMCRSYEQFSELSTLNMPQLSSAFLKTKLTFSMQIHATAKLKYPITFEAFKKCQKLQALLWNCY